MAADQRSSQCTRQQMVRRKQQAYRWVVHAREEDAAYDREFLSRQISPSRIELILRLCYAIATDLHRRDRLSPQEPRTG